MEMLIQFIETLLENPVTGSAIIGIVRSITGYLQNKWKEKTGKEFDKLEFGATLLKYEVAINAISQVLPAGTKYVGALVLIADIIGSYARKLLKK